MSDSRVLTEMSSACVVRCAVCWSHPQGCLFLFLKRKKRKKGASTSIKGKSYVFRRMMKINHFTHKEYLDGTLGGKKYLMGKLHLFLIRPVRRFKLTQLGDEAQLLFLLFFQVLLQDCTPLAHLRPKPIDTKVAAFFPPRTSLFKKNKTDVYVGVCAP